jgi:hypothetical protein
MAVMIFVPWWLKMVDQILSWRCFGSMQNICSASCGKLGSFALHSAASLIRRESKNQHDGSQIRGTAFVSNEAGIIPN